MNIERCSTRNWPTWVDRLSELLVGLASLPVSVLGQKDPSWLEFALTLLASESSAALIGMLA